MSPQADTAAPPTPPAAAPIRRMTGLRVERHATLRPRAASRRAYAKHVAPDRKVTLQPTRATVRIGAHLRLAHRLPIFRRAIHV